MIQAAKQPAVATLEDLYREPGKAELIGGKLVRHMPTGFKPHQVAFRISRSLAEYADNHPGAGWAFADNIGFAIPELPNKRRSFSPDASFYSGKLPENLMRFVDGAPALAVEVRSEGDYKPSAESERAAKRTDYFMAGTQVVWDVDTQAECIYVYRFTSPDKPVTYRRGGEAEAEPTVPGWRVAVEWVFA